MLALGEWCHWCSQCLNRLPAVRLLILLRLLLIPFKIVLTICCSGGGVQRHDWDGRLLIWRSKAVFVALTRGHSWWWHQWHREVVDVDKAWFWIMIIGSNQFLLLDVDYLIGTAASFNRRCRLQSLSVVFKCTLAFWALMIGGTLEKLIKMLMLLLRLVWLLLIIACELDQLLFLLTV